MFDSVKRIHLRANAVHDNGNGTFSIEIPSRLLSQAEIQAFESLFPNTFYQAEKLLEQEALIANIATNADMMAKPKEKDRTIKPALGPAFNSK